MNNQFLGHNKDIISDKVDSTKIDKSTMLGLHKINKYIQLTIYLWYITRWVDGMPTSEVTPVTIW